MGDRDEHLEKAGHNEQFSDQTLAMGTTPASFADWAATAVFYAALHLVESRLAAIEGLPEDEKHPQRHAESENSGYRGRNRLVEDEMGEIWGCYRGLYDLSVRARYLTDPGIRPSDVQNARDDWYQQIRDYCDG